MQTQLRTIAIVLTVAAACSCGEVPVAPVASITVTPSSATLLVGQTQQLSAAALSSAGSALTGRVISWGSYDPYIAKVSATGLATGVAGGTAVVFAMSEGGVTGKATLTVMPPVYLVVVSPATASVKAGLTQQFSATLWGATGAALTGRTVAWSSSDTTRARVSATGAVDAVVTAVAGGTATITATSEGKSGTATLTVIPSVATVAVSPATASLYVGLSAQFSATLKDATGAALTDRTVAWSSSDTTKARVSATGLLTAVAVGTATITATSEGKSGTATLTVMPVPIARIEISPSTLTLGPWDTRGLSAVAYDSTGQVLSGRQVTWSSSASTSVSVSSTGTVTANLLGSATITATAEGMRGIASIAVTIPTAVMVGANVNIDPPGEASETSVAVNPLNALNIAASANGYHYASFDGGRTWATIQAYGADPNVRFFADGTLLGQSLAGCNDPRCLQTQRSVDGGKTMPASLRTLAYTTSPGTGNPDQGMLTTDNVASSPYAGSAYIIFSDYPSSTPAYPRIGFSLIVIASRDRGATWSAPVDISDCPNMTQEPSSHVATGRNGEVYAAWSSWCNGRQQWWFTRSLDGGRTWAPNIPVRNELPATVPTTDDVRGNFTVDVDRSSGPYGGTIYISGNDSGGADAWMVRSTDGGNTWSNAVLLSDGPRGPYKYYFQPRINVAPNGRVDAVWYDTRNWSGTDRNKVTYDLYYASSSNGGANFGPSVRVTNTSSLKVTTCPAAIGCGQRVIYEYLGLTSDNTRAMPVWADLRGPKVQPYFATIWIKP